MRLSKVLMLFVLLLAPTTVWAQSVEITPFAGYRVGGEFDSDDRFFGFDPFELEIEDGESYGVLLDIRLSRSLFLEFTLSRQETRLVEKFGLFDPAFDLFDIDVDYYHVGLLYQWEPGQVRPFITGSIGATRLEPQVSDLGELYRPSLSLGGGAKILFNDHIGLRFEGRAYTTLIEDDDEVYCDFGDCFRANDTTVTQGEVRAGLIFSF